MTKFYVASSWRNTQQPNVVRILRDLGHEVYDFKNPSEGDNGFHWSDVIEHYDRTSENQLAYMEEYILALDTPIAKDGFNKDFGAMHWADACILVLPCGRSAHLEAGWMIGQDKPTAILLDPDAEGKVTPELMYKMADMVCPGPASLMTWVDIVSKYRP